MLIKSKLQPYFNPDLIEAGCDEAGRGCLAGPVYAAAVILPKNFQNEFLTDSKQVKEKERYELRQIIEQQAISWAVGWCDRQEIDQYNILNAAILSMHKALEQLSPQPEHILVDGNRFKPYQFIPHTCVVKGDTKYLSIAAASILAKTYRDDFMKQLDLRLPMYDWGNNKGYPTKKHRVAIRKYGLTQFHRQSFKQI